MVNVVMASRTPHNRGNADQRYFPRWETGNRVVYKLENAPDTRTAAAKDLSCAGACIYAKEAILPSQRLKLTVYLSAKTEVELQGKVTWQDQTRYPYLTGITFYNTPNETQDTILSHAFEIDREKISEQWFRGWDGR